MEANTVIRNSSVAASTCSFSQDGRSRSVPLPVLAVGLPVVRPARQSRLLRRGRRRTGPNYRFSLDVAFFEKRNAPNALLTISSNDLCSFSVA